MANKLVQLKDGNDNIYPTQPDTGWIGINIDTSKVVNFAWEPLSYRKIGKIVYIHGGGTAQQLLYNQTTLATGLPLPKQNTSLIAIENNNSATFNFLIDYDGNFKTVGDLQQSKEFIINGSYITRE